jgi:hypothetical protein
MADGKASMYRVIRGELSSSYWSLLSIASVLLHWVWLCGYRNKIKWWVVRTPRMWKLSIKAGGITGWYRSYRRTTGRWPCIKRDFLGWFLIRCITYNFVTKELMVFR